MLLIFVRSVILYIIVLIVMRLMGKREISQLQPFEFVISMIIANLATIPMEDARNSFIKWDCPNFKLTFNAYSFIYYKCKKYLVERFYLSESQELLYTQVK